MGLLDTIKTWFTPQQKAAVAPVSGRLSQVSSSQHNRPATTDWTAAKAITSGMQASSWVYRAVSVWQTNLASLNWFVEELAGDEWKRIEAHPVEQLLTMPNNVPFMTRSFLVGQWSQGLGLVGNGLGHIVVVNNEPVELWPLPPDTIKPKKDKGVFLQEYAYTVPGTSKPLDIPANQIIHFQLPNPADYFWGLSPLKAAARVIDADTQAVLWNYHAMYNRETGGTMLFPEEPYQNIEQYNQDRALVEDMHTGATNAEKFWMFSTPFKVDRGGFTAKEMDWLNSRRFVREEVGALYGVPAVLLNDASKGLFNNEILRAAFRALWGITLFPLADMMRATLERALVPFYDPTFLDRNTPPKLRLRYELPAVIDALLRSPLEDAQTSQAYWNMGIPFDTINQWLELGFPPDIPGADQPKPQGVPVAFAAPVQATDRRTREGKALTWPEEQKAAFWQSRIALQEQWEAAILPAIRECGQEEGTAVVAGYAAMGDAGAQAALVAHEPVWQGILETIYREAITYFGEQAFATVEAAMPKGRDPRQRKAFDPWLSRVVEWAANNAALKAKAISANAQQYIASAISQGLANGEGNDVIARTIRGQYDQWFGTTEIEFPRAMTIARTETAAASNFGSQEGTRQAAQQFGADVNKAWISSRDDRVRDAHAALDGESVDLDARYSNGLMFPGDPEGPAEEVINCRCVETYDVTNA